jgi:methyl-accepting chemotaxis protein
VTPAPRPQGSSRLFGQYIIKFRFQFRFSLILLGIMSAAMFVLWMESTAALKRLIESGGISNPDVVIQIELLIEIIGKSAFMLAAIGFGVILFLSHFLAGPLYRFEKVFDEIRDGNLTVVARLRKHDEMQDVADRLNQALAGLRNKFKKDRDAAEAEWAIVEAISKELRAAGDAARADKLDKVLLDRRARPSQIRTI